MKDSLINIENLKAIRDELKRNGKEVVFTNGCFDLLHAGHVDYLNKAKECGDVLIVALNTDDSVKRIKGEKRPLISLEERAFVLSNLKAVDYVTSFNEDTPEKVISYLIPDFLIKGSDWDIDKVVGKDVVEKNGGKVLTIDFIYYQSTSNIIQTILKRYKEQS